MKPKTTTALSVVLIAIVAACSCRRESDTPRAEAPSGRAASPPAAARPSAATRPNTRVATTGTSDDLFGSVDLYPSLVARYKERHPDATSKMANRWAAEQEARVLTVKYRQTYPDAPDGEVKAWVRQQQIFSNPSSGAGGGLGGLGGLHSNPPGPISPAEPDVDVDEFLPKSGPPPASRTGGGSRVGPEELNTVR